jgi:hypothetical protein
MAQKVEKLDQSTLDNIISHQTKMNEIMLSLGQVHLRNRELMEEINNLNKIKLDLEAKADTVSAEFNVSLKELEVKYPKGEIDINEGVVIFESAE